LDFANWETCAHCRKNRRRTQIRDCQKNRRRKDQANERRLKAYLSDRVADLTRRWKKSAFLPLVIVSFERRGPRLYLVSSRRQTIARLFKPQLRPSRRQSVEVPKEFLNKILPGLQVFAAQHDPPVALGPPGKTAPTPPLGRTPTVAAIIPMDGWNVFAIEQRCESHHRVIRLELAVEKLTESNVLLRPPTAVCITAGCKIESHAELHLSFKPAKDLADHERRTRRESEPCHHCEPVALNTLGNWLIQRDPMVRHWVPPSQNRQIVATPGGMYPRHTYFAGKSPLPFQLCIDRPVAPDFFERLSKTISDHLAAQDDRPSHQQKEYVPKRRRER
jgi:hypothetical protein